VTCKNIKVVTKRPYIQHWQFENYFQKKRMFYGLLHRDAATYICE